LMGAGSRWVKTGLGRKEIPRPNHAKSNGFGGEQRLPVLQSGWFQGVKTKREKKKNQFLSKEKRMRARPGKKTVGGGSLRKKEGENIWLRWKKKKHNNPGEKGGRSSGGWVNRLCGKANTDIPGGQGETGSKQFRDGKKEKT